MRKFLVTFAMLGCVGYAVAQQTPKTTKKAKTTTDTIKSNRTTKSGVDKTTTTYKTDTIKSHSVNKKKKSTSSAPKSPATRQDSLR